MNQNTRKYVVRQFYEEELKKLYKVTDSFSGFFPSCRIASVQLLSIATDEGFDCVEIERIQQDIPQIVANTYNRHFWYSQHSLSELYLLKIPVVQDTFALLIPGFVDDGWDNAGRFIEVFDEQGEFLGAGHCHYEGVEWMDRQLKGDDFFTPAPPWIGDTSDVQNSYKPMWSEELLLSEYGARVETQGSIIRYIFTIE